MKEIKVSQIPDFIHKKLKMAAVNNDIILSDMALRIITEHVDEYLTIVEEPKPKKRKISKT